MAHYIDEFEELKAKYLNSMDGDQDGNDSDLGFLLSVQYKVDLNSNNWKSAIATLDRYK
jgi:hypothetical protein